MHAAVGASSPLFQPADGVPPFQPIGGNVFTSGPELVAWGPSDGHLFAFAVGTDAALWVATLDGFTTDVDTAALWSPWRSLGGVVTSPPCAVRSGESSVDVFAVGANSELLHWRFADGAWVDHPPVATQGLSALAREAPSPVYRQYWESLGGVLTSPPHATLFGELNDEILVFARGTDQALWSRARVAGTWREWTSLGHLLASPPHAVVAERERLFVFARGVDSAIWCTMGGAWQSLGGTFSSAPYAVTDGRRNVFVFAADANSALSWRRWDGSGWGDWQSLGGILMSPPIADWSSGGLPYVFTLGTDSGVWRRRSAGLDEPWWDWESLGTGLLTLPATTVRAPDSLLQFRALAGLGPDHRVWFQEDDF